jgi:hypothetical protein
MGESQRGRRFRRMNVVALLPLALLSLALTAACSPARSSCHAPSIPHVGRTGPVTLSTQLGTTRVLTNFGGREWHLEGSPVAPHEPGEATVVPGTPYPMLKVSTASGRVLVLQLVLVGCL